MLAFAPKCRACGLDFDGFNVGDGAAAFGTLIVGGIVVIGAVSLQIAFAPPWWVQVAIWFPVTAVLVVGLLRVAKAALLASEYRNAAREGRIQS